MRLFHGRDAIFAQTFIVQMDLNLNTKEPGVGLELKKTSPGECVPIANDFIVSDAFSKNTHLTLL